MFGFDGTDEVYDVFELDMEEESPISRKRSVSEVRLSSGSDVTFEEEEYHEVDTTKRLKGPSLGFSAKSALPHLLDVYSSDQSLCRAARTIVKYMYLQMSDSKRKFVYALDVPWMASPILLTLTVLKGSLRTVVWSRVARYDDEYALEVSGIDAYDTEEELIDPSSLELLWTMKGLDSDNLSVGPCVVNWTLLRALQHRLQLGTIGLHAFVRLLSRIVLNLPNLEREGHVYEPMPATIM